MAIKVKFTDCSGQYMQNIFCKILDDAGVEYELTDTAPDFLFYSVFGREFLKYDCVRIFWTGENVRPDFNLCDYAIGFDYITFEDRYLRYPLYNLYTSDYIKAKKKHLDESLVGTKNRFCNFVYSNNNASPERNAFFELLSKYKTVDSGGKVMNNVGGPVPDKFEFQKQYKFSIAFENSSTNGYVTEKILQAFAAGTIPIYWGDPTIGSQFNENAFINCHRYNSFDAVIDKVREIDNNDELFSEYLHQPIGDEDMFPNDSLAFLREFVLHIVQQDPKQAVRRSKGIWTEKTEQALARYDAIFGKFAGIKTDIKKLVLGKKNI